MKRKIEKKELQTRREFFKKAAKGALPILAVTSLSGCSIFMDALGESMSSYGSGGGGSYGGGSSGSESGCGYSCSNNCSGGCDGTCRWGCETTCRGSCEGTSLVKHWGS